MGILEFILRIVQVSLALLIIIIIMNWGEEEKRVYSVMRFFGEIFTLIIFILILCAIVFGGNYLIDWIC